MKWTIIAVLVLILGSGGLYYYTNKDDSSEEITTENLQDIELNNLDTSKSTTRDLAELRSYFEGGTVKCDYIYQQENGGTSEGKAYFHEGNMRGSNTFTQTTGAETQTNILILGNTQYVWDVTTNRGYSVDLSVTQLDENGEEKIIDKLGILNLNDDYQINCDPWAFDETVIVVPSDVEFVDRTDLIQNLPTELDGIFE